MTRLPQSEWFKLDENDLEFVRSSIRKAKEDYETVVIPHRNETIAGQVATRLDVEPSNASKGGTLTSLGTSQKTDYAKVGYCNRDSGTGVSQSIWGSTNPVNSIQAKRQRRQSIHQNLIFAGCLAWLYLGNFINGSTNTSTIERIGQLALASPGIVFISLIASAIASAITTKIHEAISPIQRQ